MRSFEVEDSFTKLWQRRGNLEGLIKCPPRVSTQRLGVLIRSVLGGSSTMLRKIGFSCGQKGKIWDLLADGEQDAVEGCVPRKAVWHDEAEPIPR